MVAFGAMSQPFGVSYKLDGWFLRAYNGELWVCGTGVGAAEQVRVASAAPSVLRWWLILARSRVCCRSTPVTSWSAFWTRTWEF